MLSYVKFFILLLVLSAFGLVSQADQPAAEKGVLKSIVFFENADYHITDSKEGIHLKGVDVPDEDVFIEEIKEQFFAKLISNDLLHKMRSKILDFYHKRGFSVVSVIYPAGQDVTDGVLKAQLVVGKLSHIKVVGNTRSSEKRILREITTREGMPIQNDRMLEDIAWITNNPYRSVNLVYERGQRLSAA
jgi:hemolysin activation/secretion protein